MPMVLRRELAIPFWAATFCAVASSDLQRVLPFLVALLGIAVIASAIARAFGSGVHLAEVSRFSFRSEARPTPTGKIAGTRTSGLSASFVTGLSGGASRLASLLLPQILPGILGRRASPSGCRAPKSALQLTRTGH
jgi:hypothetical protein